MSKAVQTQSLQEKVSLTLFAVVAALALLSYVTLQEVVAPTFDQLELDGARTNLIRAERAIQNDLDNLSAITGDWGLWDDAYDYVRGEYPAFEDSNLDRPTLTNLGLSLLAVYDSDARLIWGQLYVEGEERNVGELGVLDDDTYTSEFLIRHNDPAGEITGLVRTDLGPMMFSSYPVVRSDGSGPIAGTMIMGQFLDDNRAAMLRERTEVRLDWTAIEPATDIHPELELPLNVSGAGSVRHETTTTNVLSTAVLADLFGSPLLILEVSTPRSITALGHSTVNAALLFLGIVAVIVAIVTWLLLRHIIVKPLARLAEHIVGIRKSGDLTTRFDSDRRDEIGALASEFDRLTDELHEARKLLLDQSFKAGKADNAAEVLHNIRNAMTPLINGLDRLGRSFGVTRKLKVNQAIEELTSTDCPEGRAEKLFQYLESAFSHIEASNDDAAENLSVASKQARQVEAILADQERHAKAAPVVEKLNLDEVIDEAALVLPKDGAQPVELDIRPDVDAVSVSAHRVSLLQVMGNIILNAYESIERNRTPHGRIEVSVAEETVDEKLMVRLTIVDNGCGFDEQTSEKIFKRGFSSKDGNMSGLGLHWCANALAGMGGRIRAVSGGPGQGAEFHVLLPVAQGGQR
jgi:two-component system NtrC family sensor kinase